MTPPTSTNKSVDDIRNDMQTTTLNTTSTETSTTTTTTTSNEVMWDDGLENDYQTILSVGEECINPNELKSLLVRKGRHSSSDTRIILYDGFEPSGRMHIAQGVYGIVVVVVAVVASMSSVHVLCVPNSLTTLSLSVSLSVFRHNTNRYDLFLFMLQDILTI
jgi:hypothetical protein